MSQTTTTAVAITPFDKPEFGALVLLPDRVKSWKVETDNLKLAADRFVSQVPVDLTTITLDALDEFDTRANGAIVKISTAFSRIEGERKAGTGVIDEIKAYAMLPEKTISMLPAEIKAIRDRIAREKARRAQIAEAEKQKAIDKKNEAVQIKANHEGTIRKNVSTQIGLLINAMNERFNSHTTETLEAYGAEKLGKYTPVLPAEAWSAMQKNGNVSANHHTPEEVETFFREVGENLQGEMKALYIGRLTAERDRLLELIPSRLKELKDIAEDASKAQAARERIAKEQQDLEAKEAEDAAKAAETMAEQVQAEQLNNMFDAEATTPAINQAKGTQIKRKYAPTIPASWIPIIQSWVKNDLSLQTPEELGKKLSFMLTACNKRLNAGETLTGVPVEEDYSTRSSKARS